MIQIVQLTIVLIDVILMWHNVTGSIIYKVLGSYITSGPKFYLGK